MSSHPEPTPLLSEDPFRALGRAPDRFNVAGFLREQAGQRADQAAVKVAAGSGWKATTYAELDAWSDAIAHGLVEEGLEPGDRACLFVRPSAELIAVTYALFKIGAVPVLIDPGMGRKNLLSCVERIKPRALIGVPTAHFARLVFPKPFRSADLLVTVGPRLGWGGTTLDKITLKSRGEFELAETAPDDEAAVLFTSGSTGPPKGVQYSHGNFRAQVVALGRLYHFQPGEVDLACFPLFALFDIALGMTSVFPDLDPSAPGSCDPARIAAALEENEATTTFGSPAIWRRVVPWCIESVRRFDKLKRVLVAGAPVAPALIESLHRILPLDGDVYTPYGATEALPVSSSLGRELVGPVRARSESGAGTCIGHVAPGIDLRLIEISDEPIETFDEELEVAPGEMGEICVRGPVVTREYKFDPEATRAAKMATTGEQQGLWHRMGDIGYRDEEGILWFAGRKSHRLQTEQGLLMPVPLENIVNLQPRVDKSALVGIGEPGEQTPVLIIQPDPGEFPRNARRKKEFAGDVLRHLGERATDIELKTVLFHPKLPVDVRHNAKIHRLELARWATTELA